MLSSKHALFDPGSRYSRLREAARPSDKMRGYFHWLSAQRGQPAPEPPPKRVVVRGLVPPAPPGLVAARTAARQLVIRADASGEAISALIRPAIVPADGGRRFELSAELFDHVPPQPVACRAFLIEPAVLPRFTSLSPALAEQPPLAVLRTIFRPEWVGYNLEVARILSALPELEGTVDTQGAGAFEPSPLPESCRDIDDLPERIYLVIALDAEG